MLLAGNRPLDLAVMYKKLRVLALRYGLPKVAAVMYVMGHFTERSDCQCDVKVALYHGGIVMIAAVVVRAASTVQVCMQLVLC